MRLLVHLAQFCLLPVEVFLWGLAPDMPEAATGTLCAKRNSYGSVVCVWPYDLSDIAWGQKEGGGICKPCPKTQALVFLPLVHLMAVSGSVLRATLFPL